MPIIVNNSPTSVRSVQDKKLLDEKRRERDAHRVKYFLNRKPKTQTEYQKIKLIIDGEEVEISDSAKFILEQMITDDSDKV